MEDLIEQDFVPGILTPIFSKGAPSMCLHLVMPQSPEDAVLFTCMLRFIAASCNARARPLKYVRAIRDPVTGPGWAVDVNAVAREVDNIRCEKIDWENWYRPWHSPGHAAVDADVQTPANQHDCSIEYAWQRLLESCREHGEG